MTAATDHNPDAAPPPGAVFVDDWDRDGERFVHGADHHITDSTLTVDTSCFQNRDGRVQGDVLDGDEGPRVCLDGSIELNSDQARELAALLLTLAAQIDGWVGR